MRRILLSCVCAAVLMLPAAASARASAHQAQANSKPGFLVVRKGAGDGGVNGRPVVTVVVHGFVLGRISTTREALVDIYHLPGAGSPRAVGEFSGKSVEWRGLPGTEYNGSGFRFRAIGGFYRVVVRGAGIYLFVGGRGNVKLRGSSFDQTGDGTYSLNGGRPRSIPTRTVKRKLARG
jgi:hypothetical protein